MISNLLSDSVINLSILGIVILIIKDIYQGIKFKYRIRYRFKHTGRSFTVGKYRNYFSAKISLLFARYCFWGIGKRESNYWISKY